HDRCALPLQVKQGGLVARRTAVSRVVRELGAHRLRRQLVRDLAPEALARGVLQPGCGAVELDQRAERIEQHRPVPAHCGTVASGCSALAICASATATRGPSSFSTEAGSWITRLCTTAGIARVDLCLRRSDSIAP